MAVSQVSLRKLQDFRLQHHLSMYHLQELQWDFRLHETLAKIYWVDDLVNFHRLQALMQEQEVQTVCLLLEILFHFLMSVMSDTAKLIKREVSDGVIAPGYEPEALEILKGEEKGNYNVIQIDPIMYQIRLNIKMYLELHLSREEMN